VGPGKRFFEPPIFKSLDAPACLFDIHATNSIGLLDSTFVFIVLLVWNVVLILGSQGPKLETNIPEKMV